MGWGGTGPGGIGGDGMGWGRLGDIVERGIGWGGVGAEVGWARGRDRETGGVVRAVES